MNPLICRLDWKTSIRALADLLVPRTCVVCGCELNLKEDYICLQCDMDMPYTHFWEMSHNEMADEFNSRLRTFDGVYEPYCYAAALFFYNDSSGYKNIPRQLKYSGRTAQGREFSRRLGAVLASSPQFADVDAVVPVPLHWVRFWSRGYNQAEIIAREVASMLGVPIFPHVLSKPRRKTSQIHADAKTRSANISGAFKAKAPGNNARHILIVDDTFTTGSTLAACHEALRRVVPQEVRISVASLAFVKN